MHFGSKYVYKYDHSSDESVSDDDELSLPKTAVEMTETASSIVSVSL